MGFHYRRFLGAGEEKPKKMSEKEIVKRLMAILYPYRYYLLLLLTLALIRVVTSLLMPYLVKFMVDAILKVDFQSLTRFSLYFLAVAATNWLIGMGRVYLTSWVGQRVMYDIRNLMFSQLQKLRLSYFSKEPVGNVVSRLTNDVDSLGNIITTGTIDIVSDIVTFTGAMMVMFTLSPKLSLVAFSLIPLIALISYLFALRARQAYRLTRKKIAEVTSRIEQDIAGAAVVQTFAYRKKLNISEFERLNRENLQVNLEATKTLASMSPALNFVRALGYALLLWFGGLLVKNGEVTVGTLVAFYGYMDMFFKPLMMLTMFYGAIQSALAAAERIFEFLSEEREGEGTVELSDVRGEIVYENVVFGYEPGSPVLKGVSLSIKPGEVVAIVGPTGAGKTTLINLLLRFYEPWSGRILVDGVDIKKVKLSSLRRHIGLVLQEPYLFSGTVLDNIRIAKPNASTEEVRRVIEMLGLKEIMDSLPEGLNTPILEGGKNLSVGQRQLISFVRAMLIQPKILVMDEAMSSLDPFTEARLQRALRKLVEGRTCIIIAHRLSTVKLANRIIVLDGGRIVEKGSHEELLKKGGLYARLYKLHFLPTTISS
ncbi:MAG: ABC transporter ATP-binding protein [Thermoprotei archaeon]|nr:MAG: ABC transporter ATP-binding protein [Thermoprotei archaeon]